MKELQVIFASIREIEQFVRITTPLRGHIQIRDGERVQDGKAILGLMTLGLHRPLAATYIGTEEEYAAFVRTANDYLISC